MPVADLFELVGHVVNFLWGDVFNGNHEVSEFFDALLNFSFHFKG